LLSASPSQKSKNRQLLAKAQAKTKKPALYGKNTALSSIIQAQKQNKKNRKPEIILKHFLSFPQLTIFFLF